MASRLEAALAGLPRRYAGPGGAVAVLRHGDVVARHAWGWANVEQRIAFTPQTLFRICSITKQFTCALVLEAFPDLSALDADVRARLPLLEGAAPGALQLCHNQSGLRDYWALAMLHGSPAEAPFGEAEAARVIGGARTLQFAPGTRFSYCNQNFRLLSDILQDRAGRSFAELLRSRLFEPVGMDGALLAADTRAMPDGAEGYEGSEATGFRAAENRLLWTGDAGIAACLDDMIAWERHVDGTRDDPGSLYRRMSAPACFADGSDAAYGFGLSRRTELGRSATGHGGALRGWRSHRLYLPRERVSVVVLFNHMADAHAAALDLLAAELEQGSPEPPANAIAPEDVGAPAWLGVYVEPETGIAARIDMLGKQVRLRYGYPGEELVLRDDASAGGDGTRLRPEADGLWMDRPQDGQSSRLLLCAGLPVADIAGRFHCGELDATLDVVDAGGALYGAASGFLGQGQLELLDPVGPDIWAMPCRRALDHTPPGDWTLAFGRDEHGRVAGVQVGCWLARGLSYRRVD